METENQLSNFEKENVVVHLNRLLKKKSPFAPNINFSKRIVNAIAFVLFINLITKLLLQLSKIAVIFRMGLNNFFSSNGQLFIEPLALLVVLILLLRKISIGWYFLVIYLFIKSFQISMFILSQFKSENSFLSTFTGGLIYEYVLPSLIYYTVLLWLLHLESIKTFFKVEINGKWLSYLVVLAYIFYSFYKIN